MVEKTCPICGRTFIPTPDWIYLRGKAEGEILFCRYSCLRIFDEKSRRRRESALRRRLEHRLKVENCLAEGLEPREIARRLGVTVSTIRVWMDQNAIDKTGNTEKEMQTMTQPISENLSMNDYQTLANRTVNKALDLRNTRYHALFLLAAEVGEIQALYQKQFQGHKISSKELAEEMGDVLWGLAELCYACGLNLGDVAKRNIEKLLLRYPNGFDPSRSLNRPAAPKTP